MKIASLLLVGEDGPASQGQRMTISIDICSLRLAKPEVMRENL